MKKHLNFLIYKLKKPYHFVKTGLLKGLVSQIKYHYPAKKLRILCVTGTDGKTTTTTLLHHLLESQEIKTGLITTVGAKINNTFQDTGFHVTNPDPAQLQLALSEMLKANCTHAVIETTSHGIYQYRTWGIKPEIVGLTNITHEHLDYHPSYEEYVKAKRQIMLKAKTVFLNSDDKSSSILQKIGFPKNINVKLYKKVQSLPTTVQKAIKTRFPESYNQSNATLACLMAIEAGADQDKLPNAILNFSGVPGRMEVVREKPCKVIVDFAHTPNSLEQVLMATRKNLSDHAKLILIFGCAGERDWQKRPIMGEIASRLADVTIITSEDPRREHPWSIIRSIKDGVIFGKANVISIADRGQAISYALSELASANDLVLITGKGHEKSMCYGTQEIPWNDAEYVKQVIVPL